MLKKIVRLADSQIGEAAAVFARAFHLDPLMVYAIPEPAERARLLPEAYVRMIRFGYLAGEVHTTAGAIEGAAVWLPPQAQWTRENFEASGMHQLGTLLGADAYQRYREVVGHEWQARQRDLTEPCWYLFLLGVEPARQGRGLGGLLMQPVLDRAARDHLGCYLETENERNVGFYLNQGFQLIADGEEAGSTGVRFWSFRRPPNADFE